jgi:hypothetical protein
MEEQVGGTKLQRRKPPQEVVPPQMVQQQMAQQMQQQMPPQMQQQQQMPQQVPVQMNESYGQVRMPQPILKRKSKFASFGGNTGGNTENMKYALVVSLIFVILNSKIIWKQIMKLPFMGSVEPSIVALLVNSILAGVVYYIISTFVLPS